MRARTGKTSARRRIIHPSAPARRGESRLLVLPCSRHVSGILFHGYGMPPWYDLPRIQQRPEYRNRMTAAVNRLVPLARNAGYAVLDLHESFPVNLMEMAPEVAVLRGMDRFLPDRGYGGFALIPADFPGLSRQPRLRLLRRMTLAGRRLDEPDILIAFLASQGLPLVYGALPARPYLARSRPAFGPDLILADRLRRQVALPGDLVIEFDGAVPLDAARHAPGMDVIGPHRLRARAENAGHLLDLYRYAGLLLQAANTV